MSSLKTIRSSQCRNTVFVSVVYDKNAQLLLYHYLADLILFVADVVVLLISILLESISEIFLSLNYHELWEFHLARNFSNHIVVCPK